MRFDYLGTIGPPEERGELIVMGQEAMATDCGGQQTMSSDSARSLIGSQPLGLPREEAKGAQKSCPFSRTL